MIAIADSGSTKTSWIISDEKQNTFTFKTIGLNPYFVTKEEVENCISEAFPKDVDAKNITDVYFYGSGCSACDNFKHLRQGLETIFSKANINIYSDMLGTARAVLKKETGVAAILGTGSNSCFYDGNDIALDAISLGYILGDEGSGATIGKMFVKQYLEKRFTPELTEKIYKETGEDISSILTAVYKGDHPNRFLANFTHCIKKFIDDPQLQALMEKAFDDFFNNYVLIYPEYKKYRIGFCGSVAYHFKDILVKSATKIGYKESDMLIINDVLPELLKYHLDK